MDGRLPGTLEDLSVPYFKDIIGSCWTYAPEDRPPMKQVRQAIQAVIEGNFDKAILAVFEGDGVTNAVWGTDSSNQDGR